MARQLSLSSSFKLNSGYEIPLLGFGVYQTPPSDTSAAVQEAIKAGYRHIDSAAFYQNEAACADGMLKSGIPREEVFFTTKVPPNSISYEAAKREIGKSLREVSQLKYIDLVLLHAPYGGREGRLGGWRALVEAVEAGTVRSIGVSNYGVHHLEELENYIKDTDAKQGKGKGGTLSVNQIELHPWLQRKEIIDWCQKRGVLVEAWAPLAQANRWNDPSLRDIVKRTGKTEAQILLRWSLQKGFSPLPKSVTPSRIVENTKVFDFVLSDSEMASLETDEYDYHGWDPTTSGLDN
ncbi:aldo-keto reductase (AKR), putative [Talaromyces stipitatus ATCC 10500]|uniref:D-xylose reductase [NAD(P)H] n=1 Tax=Talaromyces stipitatus (strain ATCC 10500 / CBS 375.48 / QM 6759 / NRRL 1006) TaxID=441959 RepID=B8ME25_TALSN|nr:aldo-keto reductase (AKR), putative [Talaromyces stipitatus ATCC 10500]EED16102.1 aldo-keto reductase (AKR), putative [Talaromyces stipitatus ATCC 10500]